MATEDMFEFSIKADVELEKTSLKSAGNVLDAFYNKYNKKKMKVDTSEMVTAVRDGVRDIQKLYDQGMSEMSKNGFAWWDAEDGLESSLNDKRAKIFELFKDIKVMFNDGSYVSGIDNILENFNKQLSVAFADIGGLYDELQGRQKSLKSSLDGSLWIPENEWTSTVDLRERIYLLEELMYVEKEMAKINPNVNFGHKDSFLSDRIKEHREAIEEMAQYNIETTAQLERRREILRDVDNVQWDDDYQEWTKEAKNYSESIGLLEGYVQDRRNLLLRLQDNEHELFEYDGIDQYVNKIKEQISEYEGYIKELQGLREDSGSGSTGVNADLGGAVKQLEEIRDAIYAIRDAFEPLTAALADGDSALNKLVTSSIDDLNVLTQKFEELSSAVDTISKKDFNINQIFNTKQTGKNQSIAEISLYQEKAKETMSIIEDLNKQLSSSQYLGKLLFDNGKQTEYANAFMGLGSSQSGTWKPDTLMGDIFGAESLKDIQKVLGKLERFKMLVVQAAETINALAPDSIDTSVLKPLEKIDEQISSVQSGMALTVQQAKTMADQTQGQKVNVNTEGVVSQVKSLRDQMEEVLASIRTKIEETFNLATIELNASSIRDTVDSIYQMFEDLQTRIKALDLNIETSKITSDGSNSNVNVGADNLAVNENSILTKIKTLSGKVEVELTMLRKRIEETFDFSTIDPKTDGVTSIVEKIYQQFVELQSKINSLDFTSSIADKVALTTNENPAGNFEKIFADIQSSRVNIEAELLTLRQNIEKTFDFSTIIPSYDNITTIIQNIYQHFLDLQSQISKLEFRIEIVPVSTDKKQSEASIEDATKAIKDEEKAAADAVPEKNAFVDANKKVEKSMKDTGKAGKDAAAGIRAEAKAVKESIGDIVEASAGLDKVKYLDDADGNPLSKTETRSSVYQNAIEIQSTMFEYSEEMSRYIPTAVATVRDFKKRAEQLKKEAQKIALAQKTLDKFLSNFESKTAGRASNITGFDELKQLKIGSLDDIEKATQQMVALDSEYNKVTKSFRRGTKSMNPFVNAITGIDEMENKVREVEIAFDSLNTKPDGLGDKIANLRPLLGTLQTFIATDQHGNKTITDIYGMADAYGELNVALRQVNSSIKIQKKEDVSSAKKTKLAADIDNQVSALLKQQAQWKKSGQLTDELRVKITQMFESLSEVSNSSELGVWKTQWSTLTKEVAEAKYETEAAAKAQKTLNDTIKLQDKLYNLKKQLAKVDTGSAKGQELTRKIAAVQTEYDASLKLLETKEDITSVQSRQLQLEKELAAMQNNAQSNYGKTIYNRESRYSDTIGAYKGKYSDVQLSDNFMAKISEYEYALKKLNNLREQFANNPKAWGSDAAKNEFQATALVVEGLRKEIISTYKEFENLESSAMASQRISDAMDDNRLAMIAWADAVTEGKFKFEGFNPAGTEMYGTLSRGAGAVEKVTIKIQEQTNSMYMLSKGTKQASNVWQQFGNSLKKNAAQLITMYLSLHDIIRYVRQGFTYVKEIDLALTELKKVTNETTETYDKFLETASKTASVIGSTVSDFTDATAAFARLGYSIDESTRMAETAIVYKNVADGLDTVEESTESIISTMMAYGIAADDTMSIIDRFNAVGKLCCPNYIAICG